MQAIGEIRVRLDRAAALSLRYPISQLGSALDDPELINGRGKLCLD
jgi:hypothetical protein